MVTSIDPANAPKKTLRRTLTLPLVVLYGLGVTIGAGIYVLIGATAGTAGIYAPLSFVLAAMVMLPSALLIRRTCRPLPLERRRSRICARWLRIAGAFGRHRLDWLSWLEPYRRRRSASAVVGYIRQFIDWSPDLLVPIVVALMTFVAVWGVRESVSFAAVMTLIEVVGLLLVIGGGLVHLDAIPKLQSATAIRHVPLSNCRWRPRRRHTCLLCIRRVLRTL